MHDEVDRPYDRLAALPRTTWSMALTAAVGSAGSRLSHAAEWLAALEAGELPTACLDFGDAAASGPLRVAMGELALPAYTRGTSSAATQVLRMALAHLDGLIDRPVGQPRTEAIAAMVESFRAEWREQERDWEELIAVLRDLGDLAELQRDGLRGRLQRREWSQARELTELMARVPALAALIASLGRGVPRETTSSPAPAEAGEIVVQGHWIAQRVPDAPGEIVGVRPGRDLARMVPAEAAQLRHPLLRKLWRARVAESQLMVWDERANRPKHIAGGGRSSHAAPEANPPRSERGPMLVCIDTSGSMKGAPEALAKAVVIEVARVAHRERRRCRLLAFGGPDEIVEYELGLTPDGLDRLLDFIGQSFDGGTDLAAPFARAIASIDHGGWQDADLLVVSDGEFSCPEASLLQLDAVRALHGLRVQGVLVGDRETIGLLEVCDAIHWVRDWRRHDTDPNVARTDGHSPVHSKSLTALYFPGALSERAKRAFTGP